MSSAPSFLKYRPMGLDFMPNTSEHRDSSECEAADALAVFNGRGKCCSKITGLSAPEQFGTATGKRFMALTAQKMGDTSLDEPRRFDVLNRSTCYQIILKKPDNKF